MQLKVLRGPRTGHVFTLQQGENTAGRSSESHVHLPSSHVSGCHCAFVVQGVHVSVVDRGSTNGVYVEGHKVREAQLAVGQRVQVGDWLLQLAEPPRSMAPAPPPPVADRSITRPSRGGGPPPPQPVPPPAAAAPPSQVSAPQHGGFGGPPPAAPPPPPSGPAQPSAPPPDPSPFGPQGSGGFESSSFGFGEQASGMGSVSQHPPAAPEGPPTVTRDIPGSPAPPAQPGFHANPPGQQLAVKEQPPAASGFGGGGGFGFGGAASPGDDAGGFGDPPSYGGISPADEDSAVDGAPEDLAGKVSYAWKRVRKLPWSIQLAAIMALATLVLLLSPGGGVVAQVLRAKGVAEQQVLERGKALAIGLSARNVVAIAEQNNLKLDATFLLGQPGVKVCMITDQRGVVRAPPEKVRQSIGGKDYFAEAAERGGVTTRRKGGGNWHVLAPIRVAHVDGAPASIMGWAYIQFDVGSAVSDSTPLLGRFIAALIVLFFVMGVTGLSIWRLSTAPISAVREELELAMRGHVGQVAVPTEWKHLRDLTHSINRLLERWKKGDRGGGGSKGLDPAVLGACIADLPVPVFLVDGERRVHAVSGAACSWLGSQRDQIVGRNLSELLPDPAFLDTLGAACASVASGRAPSVAKTAQVGANRVALRAVGAGSLGVLAIVAVG